MNDIRYGDRVITQIGPGIVFGVNYYGDGYWCMHRFSELMPDNPKYNPTSSGTFSQFHSADTVRRATISEVPKEKKRRKNKWQNA